MEKVSNISQILRTSKARHRYYSDNFKENSSPAVYQFELSEKLKGWLEATKKTKFAKRVQFDLSKNATEQSRSDIRAKKVLYRSKAVKSSDFVLPRITLTAAVEKGSKREPSDSTNLLSTPKFVTTPNPKYEHLLIMKDQKTRTSKAKRQRLFNLVLS